MELSLPVPAAAGRRPARADLESEVIALFDQLRSPLLRYVLSTGVRVQEAEEIVQEVFLSLYRHVRMGRSRSNLRGWIFRVAHNLALKQHESSRRQGGAAGGSPDLAERSCDPAPDPEEQMALRERRKRLLAVLRALPEQDQSCLYLRAEGLRYREIAHVLDMSLGSVSISLTRSLARLQRADGG